MIGSVNSLGKRIGMVAIAATVIAAWVALGVAIQSRRPFADSGSVGAGGAAPAMRFGAVAPRPGSNIWKAPVNAVCTTDTTRCGTQVCDGVTLTAGMSALLTNQSTLDPGGCGGAGGWPACANGVWTVNAGGCAGGDPTYNWTRRSDMASGSDPSGARINVIAGTVYARSDWQWTSGTSVDTAGIYFSPDRNAQSIGPVATVVINSAAGADGGVGTCSIYSVRSVVAAVDGVTAAFSCATPGVGLLNISWDTSKLPPWTSSTDTPPVAHLGSGVTANDVVGQTYVSPGLIRVSIVSTVSHTNVYANVTLDIY